MTTDDGGSVIHAAGGVVLRRAGPDTEVLVVHRNRRADWSLPKGKLDPGESAEQAAVREVEEETGVRAELLDELPSVTYRVGDGVKRIRWWRMRPVGGDPADRPADREVDVARWLSVDEALTTLTYAADRKLLRSTVAGDATLEARHGGEP
jgi:8-oxo-dGTP pyrophosphatase MutT (NUDIX family)